MRHRLPLGPANGAKKQRVALFHALDRLIRQGHASHVDGGATGQKLGKGEVVAAALADRLEGLHAFRADLGADAVAVDDRDGEVGHDASVLILGEGAR